MSQWETMQLGDVTTKVGSGSTPRGGETAYKPSGVPLIRSMNVHFDGFRKDGLAYLDDEQAAALRNVEVRAGDVLLNITGASIGRVAVAPTHMHGARVNQHVCIIRPDSRLDSSFLRWHLASPRQQRLINSVESGATRQALTKEKILGFEVPLPSLDEQRATVAEIEKQFSRLDEAVAGLQRVKANLKRYKAAVLKAAVKGRLVPLEAELARRECRSYETGPQLLQRVLEARRRQWQGKGKYKEPVAPDTGDPSELPEGWVWATTEQLGSVQLGRQRSPKNRSKDFPVRYLRAANITESGLDLSDVLDMEFSPAEQERYQLRSGDVVLSEASGSPDQVGKPAVWQNQLPLCCFQNTVLRLRPAIVGMSLYVLATFQSYYVSGLFAKVAGGVGINHLSAEKFSRVAVALPPLSEQYRIVAEVGRLLSIAREVEAEVDTNLKRAHGLRQAILNRAFQRDLVQGE